MVSAKIVLPIVAISIAVVVALANRSAHVTSIESDNISSKVLVEKKQAQPTTTGNANSAVLAEPFIATTHAKTPASTQERFDPQATQSDFLQRVRNEHKAARRYMPQNAVIKSFAQDPLSQRYAIDERTTVNEDGTLALTVWSDKKYYLAEDQIAVSAYLQNRDGQRVSTRFSAVLIKGSQTISELAFTDTGANGLYQTAFLLSDHMSSPESGIYKVLIRSQQHDIEDGIAFTLSQPDIQLTGNYQDLVDDKGNLVIEAQVEVASENRFYLQASLYSQAGKPIGSTQFSGNLEKGKHWVPLFFSGLMLHDAQEDGPYLLKQISVAKVTMPMQRGPLQQPDYLTEAYRLEAFSKESYASN